MCNEKRSELVNQDIYKSYSRLYREQFRYPKQQKCQTYRREIQTTRQNDRERERKAVLEWPAVKLPTVGLFDNTDEAVRDEGTRQIGMGNARIRRFMGNMVYLRLTGKSRRMKANRRGTLFLSLSLSYALFPLVSFFVSHTLGEKHTYIDEDRLLCNTFDDIGIAVRRVCATKRNHGGILTVLLYSNFVENKGQINIRTINLDAHNE